MLVRARAALREADDEVLSADAFLSIAFRRLAEAIDDLGETRWRAQSAQVVGAAARALAREQARLDATVLRVLSDVDGRDDVVPRARAGTAAAGFLHAGLGLDRRHALREATTARLLAGAGAAEGRTSALAAVRAAYAAGEIGRGHVDIAVRIHERLGAAVREALVPVTDPVTGEVWDRRCIETVDATLAQHAREFTVPEFARIAERIVQALNPPHPDGSHQRRYLHLSRLPDGSLLGRFACGPTQALTLTAVLAALAAPRPGLAVDADGVERPMPDEHTAAQRRMDALIEALTSRRPSPGIPRETPNNDPRSLFWDGIEDNGIPAPATDAAHRPDNGPTSREEAPDPDSGEAAAGDSVSLHDNEDSGDDDRAESAEPPLREGDVEIRRRPGIRGGPAPDVELVVTATLDQLAHAHHLGIMDHDQRGTVRRLSLSSPVPRGSAGFCSTGTARSSTSAAAVASRRAPSGRRCSPGTSDASSRAAPRAVS